MSGKWTTNPEAHNVPIENVDCRQYGVRRLSLWISPAIRKSQMDDAIRCTEMTNINEKWTECISI